MFSASHIYFVQTGTSFVVFAFACGILGTTADAYHSYVSQRDSNPWWLPLWPGHFDSHGTTALLGASCTLIVINLLFLTLNLLPSLNLAARPTPRAILSLTLFLPSAIISFASTVYAHILNHNAPDIDTIQTWTCRFKDSSSVSSSGTDLSPSEDINGSNADFGKLCTETKFAIFTMMTLCILQSLQLLVAVCGWAWEKWTERKIRKNLEKEQGMELGAAENGQFPPSHFGEQRPE